MRLLRLMGLSVGLALFLGACGGSKEATNQATAPLGDPPPAPPVAPPPPPQGAFLAQLTPEQTAQLNALGVEVVVPGNVPSTFTAADVKGHAATGSGPDGGAAYSIIYRDAEDHCFAVEFAGSGIGDMPATEKRLPIKPPLFEDKGYGLNYGAYQDEGMRSQFPTPELYTDWLMGKSGGYRLIGANYINTTFPDQANCKDIRPEEAQKIVESFTVLVPEVIGDGKATK
ncbi:MAG TPA: hypothetical protein V6D29_09520 [Leptolyngbyaceae cyanobacterium]